MKTGVTMPSENNQQTLENGCALQLIHVGNDFVLNSLSDVQSGRFISENGNGGEEVVYAIECDGNESLEDILTNAPTGSTADDRCSSYYSISESNNPNVTPTLSTIVNSSDGTLPIINIQPLTSVASVQNSVSFIQSENHGASVRDNSDSATQREHVFGSKPSSINIVKKEFSSRIKDSKQEQLSGTSKFDDSTIICLDLDEDAYSELAECFQGLDDNNHEWNNVDKEILEISKNQLQALEQEVLSNNAEKLMQISQEDLTELQDNEGGAELDLLSNLSQGLLFHSSLANNGDLEHNQLLLTGSNTSSNSTVASNMNSHEPTISHSKSSKECHAVVLPSTKSSVEDSVAAIPKEIISEDGCSKDLATISIALNKETNSTEISVNTDKGQQIFQFSTADLVEATAALQPLSIEGALTGVDQFGNITTSSTISGITVQDGYLVIPVSHKTSPSNSEEHKSLSTAQQVENSKVSKLWICREPGCKKVYTKAYLLKLHLYTHSGKQSHKCKHPGCEWAFDFTHQLKRHLESHKRSKDYSCPFDGCKARLCTISNLRTHMKKHQRPEVFHCLYCDRSFCSSKDRSKHTNESHRDQPSHVKCIEPGCERTFHTELNMRSHVRVHQHPATVKCEFEGCGRVFSHPCRLKQHVRCHTGERPYICSFEGCGWAFPTASKLSRHCRSHTNSREYACNVAGCDKRYSRAEHLQQHAISHTGLKPFMCTIAGCGAKFAVQSSLYVHLKKHRDGVLKPKMNCPYPNCSKRFSVKHRFYDHIQQHKNNDSAVVMPDVDQTAAALTETLQAVTTGTGTIPVSDNIIVTSDLPEAISILKPLDKPMNSNQKFSALTQASQMAIHSMQQQQHPSTITNGVLLGRKPKFGIPATTKLIAQQQKRQLEEQRLKQQEEQKQLLEQQEQHIQQQNELITAAATATDHSCLPVNSNTHDSTVLYQQNNYGSARTDYITDNTLIERAKKRRRLANSVERKVIKYEHGVTHNNDSSSSSKTDEFEMLTTQGITVRDPETGAMFVQTQLLQDDPPISSLFTEQVDDNATLLLHNDLALLPDISQYVSDTEHVISTTLPASVLGSVPSVPPSTETTINLQDLA